MWQLGESIVFQVNHSDARGLLEAAEVVQKVIGELDCVQLIGRRKLIKSLKLVLRYVQVLELQKSLQRPWLNVLYRILGGHKLLKLQALPQPG
jgi:hypothetical protein